MTITVPKPSGTAASMGAAAVAWAATKVGSKESPAYSNHIFAWADVYPEFQGEPWCAAFVTDAWARQGVDLRKIISNPYYCPNLEDMGKSYNAWHTYSSGYSPKAGDIALMGRSGYATHTGLAAPASGSYSGYRQIEGNTVGEGATGSQTNGDGVYVRFRGDFIRGWVSMAELISALVAAGKLVLSAASSSDSEDEMKESDWQRMERLMKAQMGYYQVSKTPDLAAVKKQLHYDIGVVQNQNADLLTRIEALEAKVGVK